MLRRYCALGLTFLWGCSCEGDPGLRKVGPKLMIDLAQVEFGEVPVGDLKIRGLVFTNDGDAVFEPDQFELLPANGEFSNLSGPLGPLAPGQRLELALQYQPADVGEDSGQLTVHGNEATDPRVVTLHGIGVQGGLAVNSDGEPCMAQPGSISFGAVAPGQTVIRHVLLKNAGSVAFRIVSAALEPGTGTEFAIDPVAAGGMELANGAELSLAARYTPVDGGPDSGAFVITTDLAGRETVRVPVCGEAIAPALCARPVPLDFGPSAVGSTAMKRLTLESCGREPLVLSALEIATDAAHASNAGYLLPSPPALPQTLPPGATIDLDVSFNSTALGQADGWIHASSNALGNSEAFVPLTARVLPPCTINALPTQVTFNGVAAGATSQQQVLITNDGASECVLTRVEVSMGVGEFHLSGMVPPLPYTIASGASLSLTVEYAPPDASPHSGRLELDGNDGTHSIDLLGNPALPDGCQLEVVPTLLNFGAVPVNDHAALSFRVNNLSTRSCSVRSTQLAAGSSPAFSASAATLFGVVLPMRSLTVTVIFSPTQAGPARGEVVLQTTDVDTPQFRVPLSANSAPSGICVAPRRLDFGPTSGLQTMDFRITACGGTAVSITALDWTTADPEFSIGTTLGLPLNLPAGASQAVTVRYSPTDAVGDTAVLTVRSNDPVEPAIPIEITGGPEIVPPAAGRFLYYWSIQAIAGDIMRLPLQGMTAPISFWGPRSNKPCSGCHHVSPDGRYVALTELGGFQIVDTRTNVAIPFGLSRQVIFMSWRPDVNTNPPYQYAYDDGFDIKLASVFGGDIGPLTGANDPNFIEMQPSWGSNGKIAFVRGTMHMMTSDGQTGSFGFQGPTDILVVDQAGGTAQPLQDAAGNGFANYYPAFSPNGRWIAYTQSPSAMTTIVPTDARLRMARGDLSGVTLTLPQINDPAAASSYPTWSVDGTMISFSSNRAGGAGGWDIYTAPLDPMTGVDGAPSNLTAANTSAFEHAAQWSP